jgi:GT2 family glycosyltransferase
VPCARICEVITMTVDVRADVTCVIPTAGRPALLQEAFESVLAQRVRPGRVVIVEDSLPRSVPEDLVAQGAAAGIEVAYCSAVSAPGPRGASRSRNLGAASVTTPLIAFLDDDDLWEPDFLVRALAAMSAEQADFAVAWTVQTHGTWRGAGLRLRPGLGPRDALGRNPGLTGSNFVISRSAFTDLGGFDEDLWVANDKDLLHRALAAGLQYAVVPEPLVLQRVHDQGHLTSPTERRARGLETFIDKHRPLMRRSDVREVRRIIHSIRRQTAPTPGGRLRHAVLQLWCSSPADLSQALGRLVQRRTRLYA